MGAYRFARRPRWLATHALVLGLVAGMVALGGWQLQRLDERRARNALIEDRMALDAAPVGELIDAGDGATDELRFRAVTASGEYDGPVVAVRTNQDGAPGGWVLTPLRLDGGGEVVVVLRGFVGTATDGSAPEPPPPAAGVDVEGVAIPVDRLPRTTRGAVDGLSAGRSGVLPVIVQASSSRPADDPALTPVPVPDLDDGPHLSYAVQWFLFATVGAVGYPFLLRRRAADADA
jgi:cytochrome oxidase assembly protein ShyY1